LALATDGRRAETHFLAPNTADGAGELRFGEGDQLDRGEVVEVSVAEACTRSRAGVLHCMGERMETVEQFCASRSHFCARSEGRVSCGGDNRQGQRGLGHRDPLTEVTQVPGIEGAIDLQCSVGGACALTSPGALWCWGEDSLGELGRRPEASADLTPAQVDALTDPLGFGLFRGHGCAVLADDSLRCWGEAPEGLPRRTERGSCVELDLAAWQRSLETAPAGTETAHLIGQLPLARRELLVGRDQEKVVAVAIEAVELDGAAPAERVISVELGSRDEDLSLVLIAREAEPGRWCRVSDALSKQRHSSSEPTHPWPTEPNMPGIQRVRFVEAISVGRSLVEIVEGIDDREPEGHSSHYVLRLFELRGDDLVEVFGPFPVYERDAEDNEREGSWSFEGGFPRELATSQRRRCESASCKPGVEQRRWTYDGEVYR
ncbi:MAG: hypothetical protein KC431_00255, partial [Myxococcales bacterium]|nr:hypothetical protein [Myxococcales bacterium]